ncbi:MAG: thiolase family protein [Bacteriovoracaceae bacterium]
MANKAGKMISTASKIYLVSGYRTPFGKFGGSLMDLPPTELATIAAKALLSDLKLDPSTIDHVLFANVLPVTPETFYAGRHLGLNIGCPEKIPAKVTNRLCGSGIDTILEATRLIKLDEASIVLVAGAENMSMAPHLIYGSRFGTKYGSLPTKDMLLDTLTDARIQTPMGITAENLAEKYQISKSDSDEFSFQSHQKAAAAYAQNLIQGEIAPVVLKRETLSQDQHMRTDAKRSDWDNLRPTFKKDGVVTAGSASGIVDGGAAMIIASEAAVKKYNLLPLAEIIDGYVVGVNPSEMGIGPVPVINKLLSKNKLTKDQIDLFEINEAFAAQAIACMKALELDISKVNVWGGATALGHPLGATGLKITLTLARALKHYKKGYGISSACIGGGQGIGVLLKSI